MVSSIQLILIAAVLQTVHGNQINITNGPEDYILISQLEFLHQIKVVEQQIAAVDLQFADRLDVISYKQRQVLEEIKQLNRSLVSLQALNYVKKYCIQKYCTQLITYDNAQTQLKTCHDKAAVIANSLTLNSKSTVINVKHYVTYQMPGEAAICKFNSTNPTEIEQCYIDFIKGATMSINREIKTSQHQLALSLYSANVNMRISASCSFKTKQEILNKIGVASMLIRSCENEIQT